MKIARLSTRAAALLSGSLSAATFTLFPATANADQLTAEVLCSKPEKEAEEACKKSRADCLDALQLKIINPASDRFSRDLQSPANVKARKDIFDLQEKLRLAIKQASVVAGKDITAICALRAALPAPELAPVPTPAPAATCSVTPETLSSERGKKTSDARRSLADVQQPLDPAATRFPVVSARVEEKIQDYEKQITALEAVSDAKDYPDACARADKAAKLAEAFKSHAGAWSTELEGICKKSCVSPGAFCIEAATGLPLCNNTAGIQTYNLPSKLDPGDKIAAQVWGIDGIDNEGTASLSSTERVSRDSVLAPSGGVKLGAPGALSATDLHFVKLVEKEIAVSTSASVLSVAIAYRWTPKGATSPTSTHDYEITVDHGKYYLELGILFPFVINGTRTVTQAPVPGTGGEKRIRLSEDSAVTPALALNVFPGGRRNGRVTAFEPFRAWDLFGVQLGVDLNLKQPFERVYLGFVVEPIAGISLDAGLAMVKGDVIPRDYAEGMLVPSGEAFTPDRRYFPRPYFGLTLTNEILTALTGAAHKITGTTQN